MVSKPMFQGSSSLSMGGNYYLKNLSTASGKTGGLVRGIKYMLCLVLLLVKVLSSLYKPQKHIWEAEV